MWEGKYDPGTVQNVLTHMRTRGHERVQEYYRDVDSPAMQKYWDVADVVLGNAVKDVGLQAQKDYETYLAAHPQIKTSLVNRNKTLARILRVIRKAKHMERCNSEDLERKLLRWGYATSIVKDKNGRYCHPSIANELRAAADARAAHRGSLDANQAVVGAE